ncbi:MAG: ATP-dependent DNA helicase DinG [Pseudoalteromonas rhizosphaerae]|jgi:ATP-dependent DNA helicase DinG|uniref:ATP-dependent DNA helicase DinG n=1 Tax=Pseudoalteromonas neustonica TaxID=1840331 RepID=A0ABY3F9Q7_9GAMM|nr:MULTISPECIES: ATP-dependent DNA helicase DinG [Pseudoalteromonas]MBB1506820.1 ATP-dependent DNA helicase DinG [Pseudoalteromonas sp. SG41-1]TVU81080.1 ATP-dependent DNA helicase DinG [Pseudoalteromonas neustonica]
MLSDALKTTIRKIHKHVADNLSDYRPRSSQNYLVAEIAKTLAGEYHKKQRICVIEAGTGTGKSLAYCLGALPLALAQKKKLIISTATVALQEQLISKELPFFKKYSGLDFKFDLVKGRQRYLCAHKLHNAVNGDNQTQMDFMPTLTSPLSAMETKCLQQLYDAYTNKKWQGDRDSWADTIPVRVWGLIACDKHACQRQMKAHQTCPFQLARQRLMQMDVLVINHSLLLADLDLGGGKILPEPDNSIYVIDEAHHLAHITRDFSSAAATIKGTIDWLDKLTKFSGKMAKVLVGQKAIGQNFKLCDSINDANKDLKVVRDILDNANFNYSKDDTYRFEHGEIPESLHAKAKDISEATLDALRCLNKMHDTLVQDVSDGDIKPYVADPILGESGHYINRLEQLNKLWYSYATKGEGTPHARWIKRLEYKNHHDHLLSDCPIEVGYYLKDKLWRQCAGAVLCSATLTALGSFDHFAYESGLTKEEGVKYLKVPSPFDYPNQATLHIPTSHIEPTDKEFSDHLAKVLPDHLNTQHANLVLFASYWQMDHVVKALRAKHLDILVQGEMSREALLKQHTKNIDAGKGSILFGTQSLSEGLDLPGKYLENLVITKIPFAVPTSPIEEAQAEFVQSKGGNPFLSITVPDAAKKLVQSCGRLLRKENDQGRITILDRRLVTKRYGKAMLDTLPPFKRQIDY